MRYWLYLFLLLFSTVALADSLQVTPVRIVFGKDQKISSFTIKNLTQKAVILQSQGYDWLQKDGNSTYKKTDKLFIAPPIADIAPGKTQLFRVALRDVTITDKEQAFRIYVQEVIPEEEKRAGTLQFALRIGLPVFVKAAVEKSPKIEWTIAKKNKDELHIVMKNVSKGHIQVTRLGLFKKGQSKALVSQREFVYILPQQSHKFKLKAPVQNTSSLVLQAITDSGKIDKQLN